MDGANWASPPVSTCETTERGKRVSWAYCLPYGSNDQAKLNFQGGVFPPPTNKTPWPSASLCAHDSSPNVPGIPPPLLYIPCPPWSLTKYHFLKSQRELPNECEVISPLLPLSLLPLFSALSLILYHFLLLWARAFNKQKNLCSFQFSLWLHLYSCLQGSQISNFVSLCSISRLFRVSNSSFWRRHKFVNGQKLRRDNLSGFFLGQQKLLRISFCWQAPLTLQGSRTMQWMTWGSQSPD